MYRILGTVDVGSKAPEFRARDILGREIIANTYLGRSNLAIFFYRNSQCQTCREELSDLADKYSLISEQDGEVIAISTDGIDVAKDMAVDLHLPYPVISDPNADIIKLYGAYDDAVDTAYPIIFIIDKQGVVRYKKKIENLDDLVPADDIVNILRGLGTPRGKIPFQSFRYE